MTSVNQEETIRGALHRMFGMGYQDAFAAASKLYAKLFEAAHMDDAAMMVRASEATRQSLLNDNSNVREADK